MNLWQSLASVLAWVEKLVAFLESVREALPEERKAELSGLLSQQATHLPNLLRATKSFDENSDQVRIDG
jgi:hypothetical protein